MKLACIINVWADSLDLLTHCIENKRPCVDGVIIVWSNISNRGNIDKRMGEYAEIQNHHPKVRFYNMEPIHTQTCHENETMKRNYGLQIAKEQGYTHFLISDFDEFYFYDEFMTEKQKFNNPNLNGLVCKLKVYVGKPTLQCDDHTLVPFIHKLRSDTEVGKYKFYPFAYDKEGNGHIDPTRRVNYDNGIDMSNIYMHHYSYVRRDISEKINNSSAELRNSEEVIRKEIKEAHEGYVSRLYHQRLKLVSNYFELPEL